jgi:outer membrane receptor protein involved in Fe transport
MQRIFSLFIPFFLFFPLWAQPNPDNERPVALTGRIVSAEEGGLEFATLTLFSLKDSSVVSGGVTNDQGEFLLQVEPGRFFLDIKYLGYGTKRLPEVMVSRGKKAVDLGRIELEPTGMEMDEVEISAERSQMKFGLDKRIFSVGQDLSASGGSVQDVLQNVPSVEIDIEGNVSLRGSGNVRILVDGKPSGMISNDPEALRLLQANMVERIEVVTNPSARYEAEGEVGIINIVMKKDKQKGLNGSFDLNAGSPTDLGAGLNLNFRRKWVNLFTSAGINYQAMPGYTNLTQVSRTDSAFRNDQNTDLLRSEVGGFLRFGSEFFLTDQQTLTFSGQASLGDELNITNITYLDYDAEGNLVNTTERSQDETELDESYQAALNYRKTFDRKDRVFTADLQWNRDDDLELGDITESVNNETDPLQQQSSNREKEENWLFQSDYVHPFGEEGKFETGVRLTSRLVNNDYKVEERREGEPWRLVDGPTGEPFDDNVVYTENIYAAYFLAGQKWGKLQAQGGIRAEYTDIRVDQRASDADISKEYLNWFPSAHLGYEFDAKNTVQLSYSYRLNRPRFRSLLPFSNFTDARNFRQGNPDLDPEFTNSFELGYLRYWDQGSLTASVYYRYRTGVIERITILDPETGFSLRTPVNLALENNYGLELAGNADFFDWWRMNGSFNFFRAITEGEYTTAEGSVLNLSRDTYAWQGRVNNRLDLPWEAKAQVSFFYRSAQKTTQGRSLPFYGLDLGLSRDVLKKKGTVTLGVRDVFNTRIWRQEIETEEFFRSYESQRWSRRQVMLSFNYRLNREKDGGGRSRKAGGEMNMDF